MLLPAVALGASNLRAQPGCEIIPLQLTCHSRSTTLPIETDNSQAPWFPPVYSQNWYPNCQQAAGIYYALTYELNRVRRDTADDDHHRMAANFTFNFFNKEAQSGVSYFDSFRIVKEAGNPTIADFGRDSQNSGYYWMNGYDRYYRAMHNRIDQIYTIPLNTMDGLNTMRMWLFDHLDGSEWGGVAVFSAHAPYYNQTLPPESPHAGFSVMTRVVTDPSHALTIVGYCDSICFDINADGQFTNDIDINNDGRIDLGDWEIGGYKVANSMGTTSGTGGFFYVMYSAFAQGVAQWGAANESAYAMTVKQDYAPIATARIDLSHNLRNRLSLKIGLTPDQTKDYPDEILEYQIFNFLGSNYQLSGNDTLPNSNRLEIGLDISPILSTISPGATVKFFLIADQKDLDDDLANGIIHRFSIITSGKEQLSPMTEVHLENNPRTLIPVNVLIDSINPPQITNEELNEYQPGLSWSDTLQVIGGTPPYTFSLPKFYQTNSRDTTYQFPDCTFQPVLNSRTHLIAVHLPFSFPFYDEVYPILYISDNGTVNFDSLSFPYSYICNGIEYLKSRKCIAAGYTISGLEFRPAGDSIFTSITDSCIIIRWKIRSGLHGDTISPMVKMYRSGKIEVFRPTYHGTAENSIFWGISSGNLSNYQLSDYGSSNTNKPHYISFTPGSPVSRLQINQDGILNFEPSSEPITYPVRIMVTDQNGISTTRNFQLFSAITAENQVENKPGFPSVYYLQLALTNQSATDFSGARIRVTTNHPRIKMNCSETTIETLEPQQSCTINNIFSFSLTHLLSNLEQCVFQINIESPQNNQTTIYSPATIRCPKIELLGHFIDDGHDLRVSPGETSELCCTLINSGLVSFNNLCISLQTEDTAIDILSADNSTVKDLYPGQITTLMYLIKVKKTEAPCRNYPLILKVNDSNSYHDVIPLRIHGELPQALIVDVARKSATSDTLQRYFNLNNVSYMTTKSPVANSNIKATFLLLGSGSNQHELATTEAARYADYLSAGGNLYLEGFNYWHYGGKTRLTKMLKYKTSLSATSRFDSLRGLSNNFSSEKRIFMKSGNVVTTYTLWMLGNSSPLFESDVAAPRTIVYSKDTTYKVIGSMAEVGNMTPVFPLTTRSLIGSYCGFLGLDTSGIHPLFHTLTRRVHEHDTVQFTDDSSEGTDTWQWEFAGGSPAVSALQHPEVVYNTAGNYPVKLTVWKNGVSRSITRNDYVKVSAGTGIGTAPPATGQLSVFPNPARYSTTIHCPFDTGDVTIEWKTVDGALISSEQRRSSPLLVVSLQGLPAGPAVVTLIQGKKLYSAVVVVL